MGTSNSSILPMQSLLHVDLRMLVKERASLFIVIVQMRIWAQRSEMPQLRSHAKAPGE